MESSFSLAQSQTGARVRRPPTQASIVFQRAGRGGVNGKMAVMAVADDQPGNGAKAVKNQVCAS